MERNSYTSKIETEHAEIPSGILAQVACQVAVNHGLIEQGEILPAGISVELNKQGLQENGQYLAFMSLKVPEVSEVGGIGVHGIAGLVRVTG